MSRWLAIARSGPENTEPLPDICTKPYKTPEMQPEVGFCQVVSNCPAAVEEKVVAPVRTAVIHPIVWCRDAANDGLEP